MLHVHCVHRLPLLLLWGSLLFGVVSSSPTPRKLFGEITSPSYPKPYPNNNISTWDITVPKGFVVKLNFWQFDLEPSESCLYDYVKVRAAETWGRAGERKLVTSGHNHFSTASRLSLLSNRHKGEGGSWRCIDQVMVIHGAS